MKPTLEQMQTALQNSANELGLTVKIYTDYSDKRKKQMFCVYSGNLSISAKMDYLQANMFLHGFRQAIKINHCR